MSIPPLFRPYACFQATVDAMGCGGSTNTGFSSDHTDNQSPQQAAVNRGFCLTDIQVDIIRSTCPLVSTEHNVRLVFLDIFATDPAIKRLFPFRELKGQKLVNSPTFKAHLKAFIEILNIVCESLPQLDKDLATNSKLMVLGARHATIPGYDVRYFNTFSKYLHVIWERVLGEEYTEDVRDSWSLVFDFIMERMYDGYIIFHQEHKKCGTVE